MPKLKLKGPRRLESDRVKNQSESTSPTDSETPEGVTINDVPQDNRRPSAQVVSQSASAVSIAANKAAATSNIIPAADFVSPDSPDTIKVQHKVAAIEISDDSSSLGELDDEDEIVTAVGATNLREAAATTKSADPTSSEIVNHDDEMLDTDDEVEEYDFSNDSDDGEDDNYDDGQDTMHYKSQGKDIDAVVMISSDSDKDEDKGEREGETEWDLTKRPWKAYNFQQRTDWEKMYSHKTDYPTYGSWDVTEDYQREKDIEMLRYMEDFPLSQWVLPRAEVQDAYQGLLDRNRWRSFGISIYANQRKASMQSFQGVGLHAVQTQGSLKLSSGAYPPQMTQYSHLPSNVPSTGQFRTTNGLPVPGAVQGVSQFSSNQGLRSQPVAQLVPTYPSGMPMYQPMTNNGMTNGAMNQSNGMYYTAMSITPLPLEKTKSKGKQKKSATPPTLVAAAIAPTPPYAPREKPAERRAANKSGRKNVRKIAEADEFPWNRELDFPKLRDSATWDDSIYEPETLVGMNATRAHNEPIIEQIDAEEAERQRESKKRKQKKSKDETNLAGQSRNARKNGVNADGSSDIEGRKKSGPRKKSTVDGGENSVSDVYHSGQFCFATKEDQRMAASIFGNKTPDDIMDAAESGQITIDACSQLIICWNPGKRGITKDLHQARFSIKDTLVTRQQLAKTLILTRRAAECIVDFCPDLLWRGMLLRIASEAGYGNKDVRDRMCLNGNYCDKATITKRIGSALGQKQQQSGAKKAAKEAGEPSSADPSVEKVQGYAKGEDEFYNENVDDFGNYCEFFGFRSSHRSKLKLNKAGSKRKRSVLEEDEAGGSTEGENVKSSGGMDVVASSPEAMDEDGKEEETSAVEASSEGGEDEEEEAESGNLDAVSIQSDTVLDEMDED